MSMMARFVAVTPERLNQMKKSPNLVEEALAHVSGPRPLELTPALQDRIRVKAQLMSKNVNKMPPELRQQLARRFGVAESELQARFVDEMLKQMQGSPLFRQSPPAAHTTANLQQPVPAEDIGAVISMSLDKAWHGLHYLLCGAAEPVPGALGQAVLGGTEIGDDFGYGPARFFTVAETKEISHALQESTLEQALHARFNPALMEQHGLYPGGWDQEGDDWLIEAFRDLRDFYATASEAGHGVIAVLE